MNQVKTISPEAIQRRQKEQQLSDQVGAAAASTALPGSAFDAFASLSPKKVGKYEFREFTTADYIYLQALDNPIQRMLAVAYEASAIDRMTMSEAEKTATDAGLAREEELVIKRCIQSQHGWELVKLVTTPFEEVDALFNRGKEAFQSAARSEFARLRQPAMMELVLAAVALIQESWSTRLHFEPANEAKAEDGEAAGSSNPP